MAPGLLRLGALALRATSTVCPSNPSCPQDNSCSLTTSGVSFVVNCATDFYGGDLQLAQTSTLAGCMKACAATTGCVAASYVGENCYMKSTLNAASANTNVVGISVTSRDTETSITVQTPQTCPSTYACPQNDGCTFKGTDQRAFTLSCGTDFYGGDLMNIWADDYQKCTEACANNAECIAASFTGGSGSGPCYLKNTKNGGSINNNVNAVFLDTRAQTSSTPIVSSTSTADVSTSSSTPSAIATSTETSTPIASSSSTVASSSSTTTFSTVSPSATPLPAGSNVLVNPGFETNGGSFQSISAWNIEGRVYPVVQKAYSHGGTAYAVLYPTTTPKVAISQTLSGLDTTRPYVVDFWWSGPSSWSNYPGTCTLEAFLNDSKVYSRVVTSADTWFNKRYQSGTTTPVTPSTSTQTLKFTYGCVNGGNSVSTYIVLDDVSLYAS